MPVISQFRSSTFAFGTWLMLGVSALSAQVNTATVSGKVSDPTGAAVPGATVTIRQPDSGFARSVDSDSGGQFTFSFLQIGLYELTATGKGFREAKVGNIQLNADQAVSLAVTLNAESVATTVNVDAESEALETTTSSQDAIVSEAQLNAMPVLREDWTNTLAYSSNTFKLTAAGSSSSSSQQGSGININGLPAAGYVVTVDGTNASSNPEFEAYNFYQGPNIVNTVSNDAIAQISQVSGIAPATVGNALSGNVNLITKSGTNSFHGTLEELNSEALYDARNPFLTKRPRLTFNEFGGSIGGPILKSHLFFFGDYEGARLYQHAAISGTVPTPYLESISPAAYAPIYALIPSIAQPSNPTAITGTYQGTSSETQRDGSGLARVDYNLNEHNRIAVRYIRARPQLLIPAVIPTNDETYSGHTDAVNANYLHVGRNWTEDTRFGFNQLKLDRIIHGFYEELPSFGYQFGTGGANLFLQHGNITTGEEAIAFIHGKSTIQFGGIFQHNFASRYKLVTPSIGYSTLAQYLANTPSSITLTLYTLPANTPGFGFSDDQYGGYIQDDYRLMSNLTLNLGFRYDYFSVPQETLGRFFNRGVDPANPQNGPGFGPYRPANSVYNASYQNSQPRIGFAWSPYGSSGNGLVVRGGAGIFFEAHSFYTGPVGVVSPSGTEPFTISLNSSQSLASGLRYPIDPTQYASQLATLQANGTLTSNLPNTAINPYNPNPYSIQRYFGVEQGLPLGMLLAIDYVGNVGAQEELYPTENLPNRVTGIAPAPNFGLFSEFTVGDHSNYNSLQTKLTKTLSHGFYMQASYTWGKVLSHGDADLLQQLPPQDNSNIQAEYGPAPYSIKERFVLNGRYEIPFTTWFHANNVSGRLLLGGWQVSGIFQGQTGLPINVTDSSSSYPADRPNVVPGGARYLSGYRHFPGTHQYINPAAFTLPGYSPSGTLVSTAFGPSGAQIVGGNLQRYSLNAPGLEQLDASVIKNFVFRDNVRFLLRMDAFNALNHTNLTGLNTSFSTNAITNPSSTTFGQASGDATPRTVQIGARITF